MAIGGLFSVVPVSDRSAWVLPSALPVKSGLSSRRGGATSGHPALSLAHLSIENTSAGCKKRMETDSAKMRRLMTNGW